MLARALTFLIIPILTNYFDRTEMGMYSTLLSINAFFGIFIGLSAHGAIEANFYRLSKEKIALYIGNIAIVLLISLFLCCALILLSGDLIFQKFDRTNAYFYYECSIEVGLSNLFFLFLAVIPFSVNLVASQIKST